MSATERVSQEGLVEESVMRLFAKAGLGVLALAALGVGSATPANAQSFGFSFGSGPYGGYYGGYYGGSPCYGRPYYARPYWCRPAYRPYRPYYRSYYPPPRPYYRPYYGGYYRRPYYY